MRERGSVVGRYVLGAELGAGGMGVVYAAVDPELDRKVAIKILRGERASPERQRRLSREAQALARLSHPNVIAVYDVGSAGDDVFVAMELVDGQTVGQWIAGATRPWREVQRVFLAAGAGLAAAHRKGMVHRDFKPDNVLLRAADGHVLVSDFGLARLTGDAAAEAITEDGDEAPAPALTRPGALLGTPAYMAPEQHRGEAADARSDQFAFCVALYEALYGERPFAATGDSRLGASDALALDIVKGHRRPLPRARDREVPGWLRKLVLRGLSPAPGDRWPSMDALLDRLRRDPARTWRRVGIGAAAVAMIAAVAYLAMPAAASTAACDASSQISAHWNEAAQHQIVANRHGVLDPEDFVAYSDFAKRWQVMHHAACAADVAEVSVKQLACLDRALQGFDRSVHVGPIHKGGVYMRPPLPDLDRCAESDPGQAVDHLLVDTALGAMTVPSPDGSHFVTIRDGYVVVGGLDGRQQTVGAVTSDVHLAGWSSDDRFVLFDNAHLLWMSHASGELQVGAALPPATLSVSPDAHHALTRSPTGELRVASLADGTMSPRIGSVSNDDMIEMAVGWRGTQLCVQDCCNAFVSDFVTGQSTRLEYRLDKSMGAAEGCVFLDDHRFVVGGRADVEHGEGLWVASVRGGVIDAPLRLLFEAPPDTGYSPIGVLAGHLLAERDVLSTELVRIHARSATPIAHAPSIAYLRNVDAAGTRIAASRDSGAGFVSLRDRSFTELTDIRWSTEFDVDRLLVLEHGHLDEVGPDGTRTTLLREAALALGVLRCSVGTSQCVVWWSARRELALVTHGKLGTPFEIGVIRELAVSPDGQRVAVTRPDDSVEVIDLATRRSERWNTQTSCAGMVQYVAWGVDPSSVDISRLCDAPASAIFKITKAAPPVEVFRTSDWIAGFGITGDGDLIANLRRYTKNVVVIDNL